MVYTPKYCQETDVERELQVDITDSTSPSSAQVLAWIEEIEGQIDAKLLGWDDGGSYGDGYARTDKYLDVVARFPEITPLKRFMYWTKNIDPLLHMGGVEVPLPEPVITISSLKVRSTGVSETPEWITLTQGYYDGWAEGKSDYLLIKEKTKAGQWIGRALYFYGDKFPSPGRGRIKISYKAGWNIPKDILTRYATLQVAIKVAQALVESGEPTRLATYTGGDFQEYVNNDLTRQIAQFQFELRTIERKYLPTNVGVGVLRI